MPRYRNDTQSLKDHNFQHSHYVPRWDIPRLLGAKEAQWQCSRCHQIDEKVECVSSDAQHYFELVQTAMPSGSDPSSATITESETLANVGLHKRDEQNHTLSPQRQAWVQAKVTEYGHLNLQFLLEIGARLRPCPA